MKTIHVSQRTGKDGTLSLRIPLGKADAEYEVVHSVHPWQECHDTAAHGGPPRRGNLFVFRRFGGIVLY